MAFQNPSIMMCSRMLRNRHRSPGEKLSELEIPCPKCEKDDCIWYCGDCKKPMQYDWEGYFVCRCGSAPTHVFQYKCKKCPKSKGSTPYDPIKLDGHLASIRSFGEKVILVLGQTGTGKSTWLNSIANYLTFESLDEALYSDEDIFLVPSSFSMVDDNLKSVRILVGEESATESFGIAKSATQMPTIHIFDYKGGRLTIIDTPGIGDTRGIEQDKKNFSMVLDFIGGFKQLHGICILLKPNESRLTPALRYCITQLFASLHRNAAKNIMFCLTNTQGTLYKPGETFGAIQEYLDELGQNRGICINLTKQNLYCMDNIAFRFLYANRRGVQFDEHDHGMHIEAWNKSSRETFRLFNHLCQMRPHITNETTTLNEARHIILSLAKPLALITKEIQSNVSCMEQQVQSLQTLRGDELNFRAKLKIKAYFIDVMESDFPLTVCTDSTCVETKKSRTGAGIVVYNRPCHDHCYLEGVTAEQVPNEQLQQCWAMAGGLSCRICGHSWNRHMHVRWTHLDAWKEVEDEDVKRDLKSTEGKMKAKQDVIDQCKRRVAAYKDEQKKINVFSARAAAYLKANAIVLFNDSIVEYIKVEISNAKAEAGITEDFTKVRALEAALDEYREEKRIIEENLGNPQVAHLANNMLDTFQDDLDALFALPLTGANIRKMLNMELAMQKQQVTHHQRHFDTHKHRVKASAKYVPEPLEPEPVEEELLSLDSTQSSSDEDSVSMAQEATEQTCGTDLNVTSLCHDFGDLNLSAAGDSPNSAKPDQKKKKNPLTRMLSFLGKSSRSHASKKN